MKLMLGVITSKIALLEKFIEIKTTSVDHKKFMDKIILYKKTSKVRFGRLLYEKILYVW